MFCGGRRDQRVGQLDRSVNSRRAAVCDEPGPCHHDRLADRDRIRSPGKRKCVGTAGPNIVISCSENTKLEFPDSDYRDRSVLGQFAQWPISLTRDKYRCVK